MKPQRTNPSSKKFWTYFDAGNQTEAFAFQHSLPTEYLAWNKPKGSFAFDTLAKSIKFLQKGKLSPKVKWPQ